MRRRKTRKSHKDHRSDLQKQRDSYSDIFDKTHGLVGMDRRSVAYMRVRSKIEKYEYEAEWRAA